MSTILMHPAASLTQDRPNEIHLQPRWYTVKQASEALGFGLSKTKMLVKSGELKSIKDGHHRRILPNWIDEYINHRIEQYQSMGF